jgi:hypothetical protein
LREVSEGRLPTLQRIAKLFPLSDLEDFVARWKGILAVRREVEQLDSPSLPGRLQRIEALRALYLQDRESPKEQLLQLTEAIRSTQALARKKRNEERRLLYALVKRALELDAQ